MNVSLMALTQHYLQSAGVTFEVSTEAAAELRVPASSSAVGDIIVSFQGDEVTVLIGDITHCHFTPYKPSGDFPGCSPEQAAADAAQFVHEVVTDKWVLWRSGNGRIGGCYKAGSDAGEYADTPLARENAECFVWSGRLGAV